MSAITPVPSIQAVPTAHPVAHQGEESQQQLRPDQIVRATVVEGGQDEVLLDLNRLQFRAQTRVPLRTGQQLQLQVVATRPHLELRLLTDPVLERLGHALHLLGGRWEGLAQLLGLGEGAAAAMLPAAAREGLQQWTQIQQRLVTAPDGTDLQALLALAGLRQEAQLAAGDGTAAAGSLKNVLASLWRQGAGSEAVDEALAQLLQGLEALQLSRIALAERGLELWALPLPFLSQGFLLVEKRPDRSGAETGEEGSEDWLLSLHLNLTGLGDMRIDLLLEPEGLRLRIACESSHKAEFVARRREVLEAALTDLPLLGVSITGGAETPAKTLIRRLWPETDSTLDTRV